LIGLLGNHPKVDIEFVSSYSYENQLYSDVYGVYKGRVKHQCIGLEEAVENIDSVELLFIALPHGKSMDIIYKLKDTAVKIIDFGADFRLNNPQVIEDWYGLKHRDEALLESAIYGLAELNRDLIKKASIIANPGCFPTAALLSLLPIIKETYIDLESIVIDAKSGVTGAGRQNTLANSFCEVNENIKAYSVATHRHTPEIEEVLSSQLTEDIRLSFTPHLVPMQRGILATSYIKLNESVSLEAIVNLYETYYSDDDFVRIVKDMPQSKNVSRTNYCDIGIQYDSRTNRLIVVSVIDNLVKGSAGAAIQNMNLMCGYPEGLGLENAVFHL